MRGYSYLLEPQRHGHPLELETLRCSRLTHDCGKGAFAAHFTIALWVITAISSKAEGTAMISRVYHVQKVIKISLKSQN